jgi:hypothetical protein
MIIPYMKWKNKIKMKPPTGSFLIISDNILQNIQMHGVIGFQPGRLLGWHQKM